MLSRDIFNCGPLPSVCLTALATAHTGLRKIVTATGVENEPLRSGLYEKRPKIVVATGGAWRMNPFDQACTKNDRKGKEYVVLMKRL